MTEKTRKHIKHVIQCIRESITDHKHRHGQFPDWIDVPYALFTQLQEYIHNQANEDYLGLGISIDSVLIRGFDCEHVHMRRKEYYDLAGVGS